MIDNVIIVRFQIFIGKLSNGYLNILGRPIGPFGPRQIYVLKQFQGSFLAYGMAAFLTTIYFCDWKAVLQYMPFYGGKYASDD